MRKERELLRDSIERCTGGVTATVRVGPAVLPPPTRACAVRSGRQHPFASPTPAPRRAPASRWERHSNGPLPDTAKQVLLMAGNAQAVGSVEGQHQIEVREGIGANEEPIPPVPFDVPLRADPVLVAIAARVVDVAAAVAHRGIGPCGQARDPNMLTPAMDDDRGEPESDRFSTLTVIESLTPRNWVADADALKVSTVGTRRMKGHSSVQLLDRARRTDRTRRRCEGPMAAWRLASAAAG